MRQMVFMASVAWSVVAAVAMQTAVAAEIRLRPRAESAGAMVRLGDLADVLAVDGSEVRRLEEIELFSSPQPGTRRFVRAREVIDALLLLGVNLAEHRLSGASQVEVSTAVAQPVSTDKPLSVAVRRQVEQAVVELVDNYLRQQVPAAAPRNIELELDDELAARLAMAGNRVALESCRLAATGVYECQLTLPGNDGPSPAAVVAHVREAVPVVVATRSLARGAVVQPGDVEVRYNVLVPPQVEPCRQVDDVLGRELVRALSAGQLIDAKAFRSPLMVRRGDPVTVVARSAGLVVRTTGRARDEGGQGDVITVENLLNREVFYARVSGPQQVEVFAQAIQAARPAPSDAAQTNSRGW